MINSDKRYRIFARDFFTCQLCGATGQEKLTLAHRIKSGKGTEEMIAKYFRMVHKKELSKKEIDWIIDDEDNLVTACRGSCNDHFNIFFDPVKSVEILNLIARKKNII